jgi:hypothetical protein
MRGEMREERGEGRRETYERGDKGKRDEKRDILSITLPMRTVHRGSEKC